MDHVLSCSDDLAHPAIEVEYACNDATFIYDGLGFFSYPERVGIDTTLLQDDKLSSLALEDANPFLQAWLWFGLLGEAFGISPGETRASKALDFDQFLKKTRDRTYLCTNRLPKIIRNMTIKAENRHDAERHTARLASAIQTVSYFIENISQTVYLLSLYKSEIDAQTLHPILKTTLACQVLCQSLSDTFSVAPPLERSIPGTTLLVGCHPFEVVDSFLLRAGWCIKDIRRLPRDISFRLHLSFYRRSPSLQHKVQVQDDSSEYGSEDELSVTPVHTHPLCCCADLAVSSDDVEDVVSSGRIALFRLRRGDCMPQALEMSAISLVQGEIIPYVAISHVRSAGLGNHAANAIPRCQLIRIQSLVDQLGHADANGTFFWIDTLCVPLGRRFRKAALQPVRSIFSHARDALVWDPPLYEHALSTSEEALIRIRYSTWKTRVWTLQEAFFARRLVFYFANRTVALQELLNDFERAAADPARLTILKKHEIPPAGVYSRQSFAEDEEGRELLKRFEDDINTWSKGAVETGVFESHHRDKLILYAQLRLGFLSDRRFQYFIEDDEWHLIHAFWKNLAGVYHPGSSKEDEDGDTPGDIECVILRLKQMCLLGSRI
ncbi:hypothetical protein F5X99DRAFT_405739 [Biscogniauxia marginata]|nr:hypothetical protein F5X99DRAFT_405739 [Biscogniauxia marginata]